MSGFTDIAALVARPGIDPRMWLKKGIVTAVTFDTTGVYVDTMVDASRDEAGKPVQGWPNRAKYVFNVYVPIHVGDQVSLLFPDGLTNAAAYCLGPEINEDDTLPAEILADPDSVWIRAPKDVHVRIKTEGDGRVNVDAPTIELGPDGSSDPLTCWDEQKALLQTIVSLMTTGLKAVGGAVVIDPTKATDLANLTADIAANKPASKYAKSKTT